MRASRGRAIGSALALVALAWIALIAPPCVMGLTLDGPTATAGMDADQHHDCPHCPPGDAVDEARDDCSNADGVAVPRPDQSAEPPALAGTAIAAFTELGMAANAARAPNPLPAPPQEPGPRPHLRHGQFNE